MVKRILVTGGAGYLGSVLVPELLALGHQVTVLDNFMFQQASLSQCCISPSFKVVRGDCRDEKVLEELLNEVDVVFPLAALVGAPLCSRDRVGAESTNRDAIATLSRLMRDDQHLIIPITNSGYGIGEKDKYCTEDSPLRPISLYGKLKVQAEEIAMRRKNSISMRLATVFGASPRMRLDLLVNDFVYRAVKDRTVVLFEPHFKRNYIHVRDVARSFIHVMDHFEDLKGEVFNVGLSNANLSKFELCERIKTVVPSFVFLEAPLGEDPDKRDYIVSNEKIEATGWQPQVNLEDGVRELVKLYTIISNTKYNNV